jgi:hypothetical protein
MPPVGLPELPGLGGGITKEEIVRYSWAQYLDRGLIDSYSDNKLTIDMEYFKSPVIKESGGPMAGVFNIPIAKCDNGECISGEMEDDDIRPFAHWNYPCMVGDYDSWWSKNLGRTGTVSF